MPESDNDTMNDLLRQIGRNRGRVFPNVPLMVVKPDVENSTIRKLTDAWCDWNVPTLQQDAWLKDLGVNTEYCMTYIIRLHLHRQGFIPIEWAAQSIEYMYFDITGRKA